MITLIKQLFEARNTQNAIYSKVDAWYHIDSNNHDILVTSDGYLIDQGQTEIKVIEPQDNKVLFVPENKWNAWHIYLNYSHLIIVSDVEVVFWNEDFKPQSFALEDLPEELKEAILIFIT